jgi:hypothetical protein
VITGILPPDITQAHRIPKVPAFQMKIWELPTIWRISENFWEIQFEDCALLSRNLQGYAGNLKF